MARLLGVEIPNDKKIEYSLPYIYGVGLPLSRKVLAATKIDPNIRAGELTDEQIAKLSTLEKSEYHMRRRDRNFGRASGRVAGRLTTALHGRTGFAHYIARRLANSPESASAS